MTIPHTLRRAVTVGIAIGAVAALATGCASSSSSSDSSADSISGQIVWADYGGSTNTSRQTAYFDGFTEGTGVDVVSTDIEDGIYYDMLEGNAGDYDTFQVSAADVLGYSDSLIEIPEEAQGDLLDDSLKSYVLCGFYIGMTQGWLTDTFADGGPQDWADFFDTTTYPGKRAWPGSPGSYDASYEIALLADGVAAEDLYPLDIERAEAKLDTIRDDLVFYTAYSEVPSLLTSGTVSIAVSVTGQFTALKNAGEDVTVQYNQAFIAANGFVIPSESNNPDAVAALATYMNDPERQAEFSTLTGYGPVNSEAFDYLTEDEQADIVNSPSHTGLLEWDEQWRSDNKDLLLSSYTAWLAG